MREPGRPTARGARLSLETIEPMAFGHGFISGLLSAVLGIAGLGAVVCLHYPEVFGSDALRPYYALPLVRASLHLVLVAAFLCGTISVCLRQNKALAVTGIGTTLVAALLGGSRLPVTGDVAARSYLGLDFFALNLILYCGVFVPLERLFALRPEQPVFRRGWAVDLTYFFVNSLLIEILTILTLQPALIFFDWARVSAIREVVGSWPLWWQVPALVLVADFTQYWIHWMFHRLPLLWRFHAIHHSAEQMDWLAGSRLHLVDVIVTRGFSYVPIFVLGFSNPALYFYVFIVAAQATFIHANVRWEFPAVQRFVVTPAFHHWHHSAEPEAIDKNFAVHTPIWDLLFGTYYLPGRWPASYGLSGHRQIPRRWLAQFVHPFRKDPAPDELSRL